MKTIWHRNDLRISDNKAVQVAGKEAFPLYIFDPDWWSHELVSDARREFVLESLADLNHQYRQKDSELVFMNGRPLQKLEEVDAEVVFNRDSNHFKQEEEEVLRQKYSSIAANPAHDPNVDRENWSEEITNWFDGERYETPERFSEPSLESEISILEIRDRYSVDSNQEKFGEGGSSEARRRLAKFKKSVGNYSGCISSPYKAEANTSHLSPYIRYGCISPREVYRQVKNVRDEENFSSVEMFLDRIVWQQHFNKKLEDNPELFEEAINPVYRGLNERELDKRKIEAWKQGRTGYPLVDASMRALVETGWINFRMRAMCASFFSYILKQWWKEGADFFYAHLIDADVAINYYQWQMQSGLVGVHANRIYDPTKQVKDNDPDGKFIHKYVPELRGVPEKYLAEPWKMPEKVQEECGVEIGRNYPEPILDYEREARKAREFFKKKAPEAYAAFEEDEIWEKASLSSKHDREEILEKAGRPQSNLNQFG